MVYILLKGKEDARAFIGFEGDEWKVVAKLAEAHVFLEPLEAEDFVAEQAEYIGEDGWAPYIVQPSLAAKVDKHLETLRTQVDTTKQEYQDNVIKPQKLKRK